MPRSLTKRVSAPALALLSAATLVLTGCTGGGESGSATLEDGPLSKYLSALWDGEEYTQEKLDAETKQTEELVAACMQKEGFEYTPNLQNGGTIYSPEEGEEIAWDSLEFAEQYGYGIIDWPGMGEMQEEDPEEYVDPNQDYVEALSESEQQAYYEALHGPGLTEEEMAAMEEGDGGYEWDWTKNGCYGAAQHEIQSDADNGMAAYEDPEFTDLFDAANEMWNEVYDEENPSDGVADLNREWADCMADAGHDGFTSPNAVQNALYEEYDQLQMPDGEDGEWQELGEADKKKFQEREIELALADRSCKQKVGYEDGVMKIQFDLEQKFVDAHKAELDALVAKHGVEKKQ